MNGNIPESISRLFYFKRLIWGLIAIWTFFAIVLMCGLIYFERQTTKEIAVSEARAAFNTDVEYRKWIARQGGIYIPVSSTDSAVKKTTAKSVTLNDSTKLVLVSHSSMSELIQKNPKISFGKKSYVTSIDKAQHSTPRLSDGQIRKEFFYFTNLNGKETLIYTGRIAVEKSCLKCHNDFKTGDYYESVVFNIPIATVAEIINKRINVGALGIGSLWIIGLIAIWMGGDRLNKQARLKNDALIRMHHSRNLLLEVQKIASLGSFEWDIKTGKAVGSENFYKILGLTPGFNNFNVSIYKKIIHPDDLEYFESIINALLEGRKDISWDFRIIKPDGSVVFLQAWAQLNVSEDGVPVKIISSIQDITERRKSELEIKKLSRAVEQSPSSVMMTDTAGNIVYVNSKFTETTGYSAEEITGQKPSILKAGDYTDEEYKNLWETILAGNEWRGEIRNRKKDGTLFWESESVSAIKNRFGEITNFVAVKEDITKRKEMELELNRALQREAESSRMKSVLLANMSHELRTPMNGIIGFSQLLEDEIDDSVHKQMLHNIQESGKRLMSTLNTILDLSELESDKSSVNISNFPIHTQIGYVCDAFRLKAAAKKLHIEYNCPDNLYVIADETIVQKILINLVDNAVKFTTNGSISITVNNVYVNENTNYLGINVIDTGIGIAEKDMEIIFKEFRQASEGYNRSFEGSGLGLTLARKMANLIGGNILVKSKVNQGSVFTLVLPLGSEETANVADLQDTGKPESKIEAAAQRQKELNILLVEDNETNMEIVKLYLHKRFSVEHAPTGEKAVEIAAETQFDLILMDINLGPGINGIEATKKIRLLNNYKTTPIVALTGYAMRKDREFFLKEGMTHYLAKPFEKEEIIELIDSIFNS